MQTESSVYETKPQHFEIYVTLRISSLVEND